MIYKKCYRTFTGDLIFTFDNKKWFRQTGKDRTEELQEFPENEIVEVLK